MPKMPKGNRGIAIWSELKGKWVGEKDAEDFANAFGEERKKDPTHGTLSALNDHLWVVLQA